MSSIWAGIEIFRIKLIESLQYRVSALSGAFVSIFWVAIEIVVYTLFYRYGSSGQQDAALTLEQTYTYVWLAQVLFVMQPMSLDEDIRSKIVSGDVGIQLCRPLDLYTHWFFQIASGRLAPLLWRGGIVFLSGIILPFPVSLPISAEALIMSLLSLMASLLLCTAYGTLMCIVRINIEWGEGPTYIMLLISGVLSGSYIPLQLWPEFLQDFLFYQPFAGYLDFPLRLYIGSMDTVEGLLALLVQSIWIFIFVWLGKKLLLKNINNLMIQGG